MACRSFPVAIVTLRRAQLVPLSIGVQLLKPSKPPRRSQVANVHSAAPVAGFGWDDAIQAAERGGDDPSDLHGFFRRVQSCNRGSELQTQFVPFVVEDEVVGYVHQGFLNHLIKFQGIFTFSSEKDSCTVGAHVTLHSSLRTPNDRTRAVGDVIKCLGGLIPGIRNELYTVTSSFGKPIFFSLERAAAPYFGIKAYGVHMNGYVVKNGQKFLWIGKRSDLKPTYPGMLDHLVAGGLPYGITCKENLLKECEEEAGIPKFIAEKVVSVGAVSYMDIEGYRFKRDVLFCYDLELPADFVPKNEGPWATFRSIPAPDREVMWGLFEAHYSWPPEETSLIREAWESSKWD